MSLLALILPHIGLRCLAITCLMIMIHHGCSNSIWSICLCYTGVGAVGYMDHFVSVMGDTSPEGDRILLPVGLTIKYIYDEYKRNRPKAEQVKESQFYGLWNKHFPHVSHQKVLQYFGDIFLPVTLSLLGITNSEFFRLQNFSNGDIRYLIHDMRCSKGYSSL